VELNRTKYLLFEIESVESFSHQNIVSQKDCFTGPYQRNNRVDGGSNVRILSSISYLRIQFI
jgi:hypothetical protein